MPLFRIFLHGENLLMRLEGVPHKFGFFVTRFAEAEDEDEAGNRCVESAWKEVLSKGGMLNTAEDASRLSVDHLEEIDPSERPDEDPGFVWFPEEDEIEV